MSEQKINGKYIISTLIIVIFTWIIHEFTHWITSESLGYESIMRLNSVSLENEQERTEWHKIYISASGPVITIFQAILAFSILKTKGWNKFVYPILFVPFYMRLLAGIMNFINPNDEGRISEFLGIGLFTISIIISGFLFFLVFKISKKYRLNWKFNFWTTIITMVVSSIIILSDQFFGIRIL
ncbi:hypothetical protein [Maribacter sp. 4G9]|uniref:hypothetical protein n=1 Tax=Maribacter sp. 4G9 TaxID=1889777 RepID=UPI000C145DDE|nr:hypothetical protein [Maribacter sp. 4G9]PIB38535.1 hypothetical protein BFP75_15950 [Maribacter sp. 4G9]|tara:strand:- start:74 stop:622 length:549 start_codon:yes stop_codon:yes gene_type:complete